MMKKTLLSLSAALLLFSGLQPAVYADTTSTDGEDDPKQNVYVFTDSLDTVAVLDLSYVLDRALKNSHNLSMLTLKYAAQGSKKGDLQEQLDEMGSPSFTPVHLPNTPTEIASTPGMLLITDPVDMQWTIMQNTAMNQILQGMGALAGGMNSIIGAQRAQMKTAVHQLDTDQRNSLLQSDEAEAGIRLQLIAQYAQLLGQKKQLDFMQEYQAVIEKEWQRAELLRQQGLASEDDVQAAVKALNKQKDDIVTLTNNYRLALVQLCTDIGISYDPNQVIKDIDPIIVEPVAETDTVILLKKSYQMKMAGNNIDESVWESGYTVTQTTYGEQYLGVNQALSGQKNEQTRLELTKKIQATYNDARNAYQACLTEQRNLSDIQTDLKKVQFRYSVGVISKHDLNKFALKVRQNETTLAAAKLKYYVLQQKAEAMDTGVIQ